MEPPQRRRVCRHLLELIEQLGVRVEAWDVGRVVLTPIEVIVGSNDLELLNDVAIAFVYASVLGDESRHRDVEMRVAFIALQTHWSGLLCASANASQCPGRGWLIDAEVRAGDRQLISAAFAYAPPSLADR
jgi:hypothetical protein